MKLVADTNTFLAVALNEPERDYIIECTKGYDLLAPELLPFEIGNALTALVKRNILSAEEVFPVWESTQRIPVKLRQIDISSALNIAVNYNIYAYDAYFLICAESLRIPLLTLDRNMKRIAKDLKIKLVE